MVLSGGSRSVRNTRGSSGNAAEAPELVDARESAIMVAAQRRHPDCNLGMIRSNRFLKVNEGGATKLFDMAAWLKVAGGRVDA